MFPILDTQGVNSLWKALINPNRSRRLSWMTGGTFLLLAAGSLPVSAQTSLVNETFSNSTVTNPAAFNFGVANTNSAPPCLTAATPVANPPTTGVGQGIPACDSTAVPGTADPAASGTLRLTSAQGNQATFVLSNQVIASGQGLQITFDYFSYGGTGADGLSFFLQDATAPSTNVVGGFGGSLGYAPSTQTGNPGLVGGYVGVGFDEFGNFSNPIDQGKAGGGPGLIQDSVAIRGPAAGGYQYLTGTASLPQGIDVPTATTRAAAQRTARITLTPSGQISVDINFGAGFVNVIPPTTLPTPPANFRFGFASSTGGSTNIHEISNLGITTLAPNLNITKTGPANGLTIGQPGAYTINVANAANAGPTANPAVTPNPITVTDTLPAGLNFVSATGTGWTCAAVGQVVTCTYNGPVIAPGASAPPITINILPIPAVGTSAVNRAKVATPGDDPDNPPVPPNQNLTADNTTTLTVPVNPSVLLAAAKTTALVDTNSNGVADPGETLTYTINISNNGNVASTNTIFTDQIPAGTTYVPNTTRLNNAPVADTANAMPFSGSGALVNSPRLPAGQVSIGGTATVQFQVTINQPPNVTKIENQGSVTSDQQTIPVPTDDPTLPGASDPTVVLIGQGVPTFLMSKLITNVTRSGSVLPGVNFKAPANLPNASAFTSAFGALGIPFQGVANISSENPLQNGDEVEYTVYFISNGSASSTNVKICDAIPAGTTFIPNSFGAGVGMLLNQGGTQTPLTNTADTDKGTFASPLTAVTAPCPNTNNPTGSVFFPLGDIPNIAPNNAGFVRFRVKID